MIGLGDDIVARRDEPGNKSRLTNATQREYWPKKTVVELDIP